MQELITKAAVLLEALPYLQRFRGQTFVVKYGGSFMDSPDPALRQGVARDVVFVEAAGINPVVVHGGGKAITRAMEVAGLKASFVQGFRVTDEAAANVVEQVLSHEINPEIVSTIRALGGQARGFSGSDIFGCRKLWLTGPAGEKLDPGFVGEVTSVNLAPLADCLRGNIIPVISPTARGEDGRLYNCNADVAAAQAAIALLKAIRLVFMSDVPRPAARTGQARLGHPAAAHRRTVAGLKQSGVIDHGMIPKVDRAPSPRSWRALKRVSFVDGRMPHAVLLEIFTDQGVGTEVVL